MEVSTQLYAPTVLSLGEEAPGTHWTGIWINPRVDLNTVV
jgi:hypothetical protein